MNVTDDPIRTRNRDDLTTTRPGEFLPWWTVGGLALAGGTG
jgi:hypothetical protein